VTAILGGGIETVVICDADLALDSSRSWSSTASGEAAVLFFLTEYRDRRTAITHCRP